MASRPGLGLDPRYPPRGRGMGWEATLRLRPGRVGGGRELLAVHPRLTLALGPGHPALGQHPQRPEPRPRPRTPGPPTTPPGARPPPHPTPPERLHPGPSSPTPALPAPPPRGLLRPSALVTFPSPSLSHPKRLSGSEIGRKSLVPRSPNNHLDPGKLRRNIVEMAAFVELIPEFLAPLFLFNPHRWL